MSKKNLLQHTAIATLCLYVALGLSAIFLPIILWKLNSSFVVNTYGEYNEIFELFGFSGSVAFSFVAFIELKNEMECHFRKYF